MEKEKVVLVKIRPMTTDDIKGIMEIDSKFTGEHRAATFHRRIESYLAADPLVCRVAEVDGKIIGFMLGDIKGWEYGAPEAGWIEIMGVDPEYQRNEVGRKLAESLFEHFQRVGIKRVFAPADKGDTHLLSYFKSLGFRISDLVNLEKDL